MILNKNKLLLILLTISFQAFGMERNLQTAACALAMLKSDLITPKKHPGIPEWPKHAALKCKTIEKLAEGPYKGHQAKIERSLWSLYGVDTIDHTNMDYVFGSGLPMLYQFFIEADPFSKESRTPLYYGKIAGRAVVIPECWLSKEDRNNLLNFHRYELSALAPQLFARSGCLELLFEKIQRDYSGVFTKAALEEAIKHNKCEVVAQIMKLAEGTPAIEIPATIPIKTLADVSMVCRIEKNNDNKTTDLQKQIDLSRKNSFATIGDALPIFKQFPKEINAKIACYLFYKN
jgi:hypothetical protein